MDLQSIPCGLGLDFPFKTVDSERTDGGPSGVLIALQAQVSPVFGPPGHQLLADEVAQASSVTSGDHPVLLA